MAATGPRKTSSIHDYPEHLNPFREEDNHNKIRFWTLGRKLNRSNSITSFRQELKNSWAFRSFMKKGKKGDAEAKSKTNQENGEESPVMFRRALQYSSASTGGSRSTVASPERYVYGGSVTPLPRSRFQERLRSTSHHEGLLGTPRMARSEISGSRLSVESTNPFEEPPVPPVRASRRKKKRAPQPPNAADVSVSSETSELQITETEDKTPEKHEDDLELHEMNLTIELKIVEDDDLGQKSKEAASPDTSSNTHNIVDITPSSPVDQEKNGTENAPLPENAPDDDVKNGNSEDLINSVPFKKVDIVKYRRNSSVDDDDIRLRRGNLEDFHSLANKRSKSLSNTADSAFVTYDINLNEDTKDRNGNEPPQKVVCKLYESSSRKQSIDTISSTEREFMEIDKVRRQFETEINKLNAALAEDDFSTIGWRKSVSEIKRNFENDASSPNPIPKPRRSHYSDSSSPINGNVETPLS